MPHKRNVQRVDSPPDSAATLKALAKALGVTDDTVTQWKRRGLTVGAAGAWSITGTYRAARKAGLKPRLPDDARLVELIQGSKPDTPPPIAHDESDASLALPGHSAYDALVRRGVLNYKQAQDREELIGEEMVNVVRRVEADKARDTVVDRAEADRAASRVRDRFLDLIKRMPAAVIDRLGDQPHSIQQLVLIAVENAGNDLLEALI